MRSKIIRRSPGRRHVKQPYVQDLKVVSGRQRIVKMRNEALRIELTVQQSRRTKNENETVTEYLTDRSRHYWVSGRLRQRGDIGTTVHG